MLNLLSFDVETGGLTPGKHSLLEVGMVAYKDGAIAGTLQLYVKEEEYVVTPRALEINQLDLVDVYNNGQTPHDVVCSIIEFIREHFEGGPNSFALLGHNLFLDRGMLYHLFEKENFTMDAHITHRTIDTMGIIWAMRDMGLLPMDFSSGLQGVAKYLGVAEEGSEHTALGDAKTTLRVYLEMIKRLKGESNG